MSATGFAPTVTAEQAWDTVLARAPGLSPGTAALRHHPFSGFVHLVHRPVPGRRLEDRVHTLVDRCTGTAFITDPWPRLEPLGPRPLESQVSDPGWNSVGFDEARARAARTVRAAALRRARLGGRLRLEEVEDHELVWKPNWLLTGTLGDRQLKILVDALSGGYYVVGS